jgi:hypothetical protein
MLVVFAFSITPQKSIHDTVARHVDPSICKVHLNLPITQVENQRIHCSYDQLVVTSAFLHYNFEIKFPAIAVKVEHVATELSQIANCNLYQFDTRGPPII